MNKWLVGMALVALVMLIVAWWLLVGAHMLLPNGRCLDPRLYGPGC